MCVVTRNLFCTAPFNRRRWRNKWQPPVKSSAWFFEFELNPKCRAELDRFCDALIPSDRFAQVEKGKADLHSNVLKDVLTMCMVTVTLSAPFNRRQWRNKQQPLLSLFGSVL
ncbi:hypothetical protein C1H46_037004 [Malus baccata]|uniref:Uncharacterized protein n=1 Tax=Malus baccata TaxID=106549 RepID=A0A540KTF6_MALBA|nr:hypothetical protein C1H46_037004 [Malus baccata]